MAVRFQVDPDKEFQKAIAKVVKEVDDLTIPFQEMTRSWFKSNRAIFALKSPGKYTDLTANYKKQKVKAVGFIYPILKRSGRLADSITKPDSSDAITEIINKKTLVLGSKVPYGSAHQFGTKVLPQRPWILLGAEQTAPEEINRRRDAWVALLADYLAQKSAQLGKVTT
jgi:phage gpG-like protein